MRFLVTSLFTAATLTVASQGQTSIVFRQGSNPSNTYTHAAASIQGANVNNNLGASPALVTGQVAGGGDYRTAFSFDLSAIPAGQTITSVALRLTSFSEFGDLDSEDANFTLQLFPLTASFSESGVTWNSRDGTANWTNPGGDFDGSTLLSSISANPTSGGALAFASSLSFVSTAQTAYNSGATLNLILKLDATGESGPARRLFTMSSDDRGIVADRPALSVTYVPEPGSVGLLVLGGGLACAHRRPFGSRRSAKAEVEV
jgi:hypothetical protein